MKLEQAKQPCLALCAAALLAACGGGSGDGGDNGGGGSDDPTLVRTAVVLTTDFTSGSLATMPVDDPTSTTIDDRTFHSDAVARTFGSMVYVLNRFGADNVQLLDAANGYETLWQCSVGNGKNPHDIVKLSDDEAYVALYGGGVALVNLDPSPDCSDFIQQEIDLSSLADEDGVPEADRLVLIDGTLYVTLQRLVNFAPSDASLVALIDTSSNTLTGSITLSGTNPFSETKGIPIDPSTGKLLVATTGAFGVNDGGIERVDPATRTAEGYFITEADLGGDINDFAVLSATRGYAIVSDVDFNNSLVSFDPSTGTVRATLATGSAYLPDLEYDPATDQIFLASQDFSNPGIRIFASDDTEVTSSPIGTGLPPFNINFVD